MRFIYVSLNTWHAMIAFPQHDELSARADQQQVQSSPPSSVVPSPSQIALHNRRYEEWGFAERAWYLEGRTGLGGVIRALLWPTEGVVEVGRYDQVWAERTPQPPSDLFIFQVSEEGYRRLRRHLDATIADRQPLAISESSLFYAAERSYHFFHNCHQYAAQSLREAGLPLSPFWAVSRSPFAWQLRRAERISREHSLATSVGELP